MKDHPSGNAEPSAEYHGTWIDTGEISLHYKLEGNGPTGLLLIHELGGCINSWDAVAHPLRQHAQVLRYDQRGHGLSEKIRHAYSLDQHVDDLVALLDRVNFQAPCWLIPAAAGAAIAVSLAARLPDRVAGIVMCAPALDTDAARRLLLDQRAALAVDQGMRAVVEATLDRSWPQQIRTDIAAFERYRALLLGTDPHGYALANQALSEMELSHDIEKIQCRCLLLAGSHDLLRPPERVERQALKFKHAEFTTISSGHLMAAQNPDELVKQICRFI